MPSGTGWSQIRINITTQWGKLQIHNEFQRLKMYSEQPRVIIDQRECFSTMGLKSNPELVKEGAQLGYRQAMQYTAKKASDGDRLAAVENGGQPMIDIAIRDSVIVHEFNVDCIPKARPKISLRRGTVSIDTTEIAMNPDGVTIRYTPGGVKFEPEYIGGNLDIAV